MATSIINQNLQNLQDPETEFGLRPNTDDPMPLGVAMMPEGVRSVYDVASNYNRANNLQNNDTSGGYLSNLRHGTAASQMRDALGGGPLGIFGANVLGLAQEVPGLAKGVTDEVGELFGGPKSSFMNTLNQTGEDIYANLYGSLYGKKGTTAETYADLANKFATDTGFINTALDATANKQNSLMPDRNALNQSGLFNAITNYGVAKEKEKSPTSNYSSIPQDITKTTNFNDFYNYNDVDAMTADEQGQLPFDQPTQNQNFLTGILESLSDLELQDYLPFGEKSLSGMAVRGAGNMVRGIGNFFQGNPRQRARNEANKRFGVGDIYGYGMGGEGVGNKDAFGFNTVSGFGDYEQHMRDQLDKLNTQKQAGKTFRPGSWQEKMVKDYGESISTIDAEAAAADRAEKAKFDRMLSSMSGGRNTGGGTINSSNTGGYGGTGGEGPSSVGSSGMLGGGV